MSLIEHLPDSRSVVYALRLTPIALSRYELPAHVTTIARRTGNLCAYSYDGNETIYIGENPFMKCSFNVTQIASLLQYCIMLTTENELYYANSLRVNPPVMKAESDSGVIAITSCNGESSPLALMDDGTVKRIAFVVGGVGLEDLGIKFPITSPDCKISSTCNTDFLSVVVWDVANVWYRDRGGIHHYTPGGVGIKTCVMTHLHAPLVLLSDGKLIDPGAHNSPVETKIIGPMGAQTHRLATNIKSLASCCVSSAHALLAVDDEGNTYQVSGHSLYTDWPKATMGNCPVSVVRSSTKRALRTP